MTEKKRVKKEPKPKKVLTPIDKKRKKRRIINTIAILIICCGLIGATVGVTIIASIIKSSTVVLDIKDLDSPDSTIIYDRDGNEIGTVGLENRINITYDDLPQVVIDAFVSIEDSRFFEHSGFDIPRFTKALLENLKSMSFEQGGSTLTMQMIKNTYFVTEESLAEKSINRKVQEIYLALKVEKMISKKKIFELYINKINFGGTARGIQAAAKYYFNKDCSELTLSEAATLAGVINAPNTYNPYYNVDWATLRRNETLQLMVNHGYISQQEADIAAKINIEDILVGTDTDLDSTTSDSLQSYIDAVLDEVEEITGEDPYTTPMRIYTAMDARTQKTSDNIIQGKSFKFPDKYMQCAFAVVDNSNGEIVALGGGRGRTGERVFSFATDARKQPGSSIKVIIDYALAFEYAGITTQDVLLDDRTNFTGSSFPITNASGRYAGELTLQHALSASLNIPAVKELRKVLNAVGKEKVIEYLKAIGFDEDVADLFDEQYGIGGSNLTVSPLQMAAAQAMLFNNGVYITPHTIRRIEYIDGSQEPFVPTYEGVQVISPAAAWCIAEMMEKNVSHDIYLGNIKAIKKSYPVYAKTGTSDWGTAGLKYGIPQGAAKDNWMNASTSEFTMATWIGYDVAIKGKKTYLTTATYNKNYVAKIDNRLLDALQKSFGTPAAIKRPSDATKVSHVLGTWPYLAAPSWCPSKYITSGWAKKGSVTVTPWPTPTIDEITSFNAVLSSNTNNTVSINCNWSELSAEMPTKVESKTYKLKAGSKGTRMFSKTWIDGVVRYYVKVTDENGNVLQTFASSTSSKTISLDLSTLSSGHHTLTLTGYYAYTIAPVTSGTLEVPLDVTITAPVVNP